MWQINTPLQACKYDVIGSYGLVLRNIRKAEKNDGQEAWSKENNLKMVVNISFVGRNKDSVTIGLTTGQNMMRFLQVSLLQKTQ